MIVHKIVAFTLASCAYSILAYLISTKVHIILCSQHWHIAPRVCTLVLLLLVVVSHLPIIVWCCVISLQVHAYIVNSCLLLPNVALSLPSVLSVVQCCQQLLVIASC